MWTRQRPLRTRRNKVCHYLVITYFPHVFRLCLGETPLPDVVSNAVSAGPSIAPLMDVRPMRKAPDLTHITSELLPPVEASLSGKAPTEPQTAEAAPPPRRVRATYLLFTFVLNIFQPPPRRANRATTPSEPGDSAVVAEASQLPAPAPEASQLPTVCAVHSDTFLQISHSLTYLARLSSAQASTTSSSKHGRRSFFRSSLRLL